MKRIEIFLLLLAMVFAGCEKIKNQVDVVQGGIKSNITEILDSTSDSEDAVTTLIELEIYDTNSIGMSRSPVLNNPYSTGYQYPLFNPLRIDTALGIGKLQYPYQLKNLTRHC